MAKLLFIVGNSRSGTTMMLRILNNHSKVYGLNELHFFEHLWSPSDKDKELDRTESLNLLASLIHAEKEGYFGEMDSTKYRREANELLESRIDTGRPHEVFRQMMEAETRRNGKEIPCEKTPQNVFYIREILELFPEARIVNMVRDPRAVMLSQKNKWKRRKMGATFISKREVWRLRINYHPFTLSKLWNSAVSAALKHDSEEALIHVRFEDMINEPESTIRRVCRHFGIDYEEDMLKVPMASSSTEKDSDNLGIRTNTAENWKKGGLNKTEIHICQRTCGELMSRFDYEIQPVRPGIPALILYTVSFPVKLALALLFNLKRMKNMADTLKRRLRGG